MKEAAPIAVDRQTETFELYGEATLGDLVARFRGQHELPWPVYLRIRQNNNQPTRCVCVITYNILCTRNNQGCWELATKTDYDKWLEWRIICKQQSQQQAVEKRRRRRFIRLSRKAK